MTSKQIQGRFDIELQNHAELAERCAYCRGQNTQHGCPACSHRLSRIVDKYTPLIHQARLDEYDEREGTTLVNEIEKLKAKINDLKRDIDDLLVNNSRLRRRLRNKIEGCSLM